MPGLQTTGNVDPLAVVAAPAVLFVVLGAALTGVLLLIYVRIAVQDFAAVRSVDDFFVYRRRLDARGVFSTFYASGMSLATVFIAFMQLAPDLGLALLWAVLFYSAGHLLLWLLIPRIKTMIDRGETIHTFLGQRYASPAMRRAGSVATVVGFVGVFATELIVGTYIFESLFGPGSSYWAALVLFTSILLTYALLGGFRSVVRTDMIQSLAILFVTGLLVLVAFSVGGPVTGLGSFDEASGILALPWLLLLNFFLINVLFPLIDMSAWQRVAAAVGPEAARAGVLPAALFFFVTWGLIVFSAVSLSTIVPADQDGGIMAALTIFAGSGVVQAVLGAVGVAALVAAMLSTADTFLIAASQSMAMDIRQPQTAPGDGGDEAIINLARSDMLLLALCGLLVCLGLKAIGFRVDQLVFAVYGSSLALVPTVALALAAPIQWSLAPFRLAAIGSILAGLFAGWGYGVLTVVIEPAALEVLPLIGDLPGPPSPYNAPTVALGASVLVFAVLSVVERARAGLLGRRP